jgi:hypothetical protein
MHVHTNVREIYMGQRRINDGDKKFENGKSTRKLRKPRYMRKDKARNTKKKSVGVSTIEHLTELVPELRERCSC